ncbi:uncharacterized protein LOC119662547 [Teleopsis dalmanni]|uniref:uncharacterized protein LOC119662547 n=1 Tax=Teleopsis dalmanni TaxID=139649 RepID=UPI0018CE7872|nr:uncharacterized protein LOC119662547 [Teleopsis dalmanni]
MEVPFFGAAQKLPVHIAIYRMKYDMQALMQNLQKVIKSFTQLLLEYEAAGGGTAEGITTTAANSLDNYFLLAKGQLEKIIKLLRKMIQSTVENFSRKYTANFEAVDKMEESTCAASYKMLLSSINAIPIQNLVNQVPIDNLPAGEGSMIQNPSDAKLETSIVDKLRELFLKLVKGAQVVSNMIGEIIPLKNLAENASSSSIAIPPESAGLLNASKTPSEEGAEQPKQIPDNGSSEDAQGEISNPYEKIQEVIMNAVSELEAMFAAQKKASNAFNKYCQLVGIENIEERNDSQESAMSAGTRRANYRDVHLQTETEYNNGDMIYCSSANQFTNTHANTVVDDFAKPGTSAAAALSRIADISASLKAIGIVAMNAEAGGNVQNKAATPNTGVNVNPAEGKLQSVKIITETQSDCQLPAGSPPNDADAVQGLAAIDSNPCLSVNLPKSHAGRNLPGSLKITANVAQEQNKNQQ